MKRYALHRIVIASVLQAYSGQFWCGGNNRGMWILLTPSHYYLFHYLHYNVRNCGGGGLAAFNTNNYL
jgi:hypothetical protein